MRRYSSEIIRKLSSSNIKKAVVSSYITQTLVSNASSKPMFALAATAALDPTTHSTFFRRTFSSGPSNIVVIDSVETFNESLRKVKDEALPAIFYFTAAWCGPCRLLSPVIGQLSEKYPHVTTYKIDIDQEVLGKKLSELSIHSVPTLHFFKDGVKNSEVIGADLERLKHTMAKLYEKSS